MQGKVLEGEEFTSGLHLTPAAGAASSTAQPQERFQWTRQKWERTPPCHSRSISPRHVKHSTSWPSYKRKGNFLWQRSTTGAARFSHHMTLRMWNGQAGSDKSSWVLEHSTTMGPASEQVAWSHLGQHGDGMCWEEKDAEALHNSSASDLTDSHFSPNLGKVLPALQLQLEVIIPFPPAQPW